MPPLFAYVHFIYDKTKRKVPVGYIKDFNIEDYGKMPVARLVYWNSDVEKAQKSHPLLLSLPEKPEKSGQAKDSGYFKAEILCIAGSLEKLDKKIAALSQKLCETQEESSESETSQAKQLKKKKKIQTAALGMAKQSSLRAIINKEKALKRMQFEGQSSDSNSEGDSLDDDSIKFTSTPRRKSSKSVSKDNEVNLLQKKVTELEEEVRKLRGINVKLQDALLMKVQTNDNSDDRINESCGTNSSFDDKYQPKEGKVFLGSDVWVTEEQWTIISSQRKDSKFTKSLAVAVWGSDELSKRSVAGAPCPTKSGQVAKPALTPKKLAVIEGCLGDFVRQDETQNDVVKKRVSRYRSYIREKIQDLNYATTKMKKT